MISKVDWLFKQAVQKSGFFALLMVLGLSFPSCYLGRSVAGQPLNQYVLPKGTHPALNASNSEWDEHTQTLKITLSVQFPKGNTAKEQDGDVEGFYFSVPPVIKKIIVGKGVRITGGFRANANLELEGSDHHSSVIYGTISKNWSYGPNLNNDSKADGNNCNDDKGDDYVHDCMKWNYGGVSVNRGAAPEVFVSVKSLKIENARTYGITSLKHRMLIEDVHILNSRPKPDFQSNSDGIGAGKGTVIRNCKIDVWDDAIKLYNDMLVENTTIIHNDNGAPFQLGWGTKPTETSHQLKNVLVVSNNKSWSNLALFSASLTSGTLTTKVSVDGLRAIYRDSEKVRGNEPLPLIWLKSEGAKLHLMSVKNSVVRLKAPVAKLGPGTLSVSICDKSDVVNEYNCGDLETVRGCGW